MIVREGFTRASASDPNFKALWTSFYECFVEFGSNAFAFDAEVTVQGKLRNVLRRRTTKRLIQVEMAPKTAKNTFLGRNEVKRTGKLNK